MDEIEKMFAEIDPASPGCRQQIMQLRRQMDEACDSGKITIKEWRAMLDRIAAVQSKCSKA
jgi:hypothetical protein